MWGGEGVAVGGASVHVGGINIGMGGAALGDGGVNMLSISWTSNEEMGRKY